MCSPRRAGAVAVAGDEARVVDGDAQRRARLEGLLQAGEARVAVHEHGVEVLVGQRGRAVVVLALVGARADEDVAQAAGGEGAQRARLLAAAGSSSRANFARPNGNSSTSTTCGRVVRSVGWMRSVRTAHARSVV